jgi:hypothetical protein
MAVAAQQQTQAAVVAAAAAASGHQGDLAGMHPRLQAIIPNDSSAPGKEFETVIRAPGAGTGRRRGRPPKNAAKARA